MNSLFTACTCVMLVLASSTIAATTADSILEDDLKKPATLYRFSVAPQRSATTLLRRWGPVLRQLERNSGVKLNFSTAPNIATFEQRLLDGESDFAYANPHHFVELNKLVGYEPLAHAKQRRLKGVIVTRTDSKHVDLEQLSGTTVAFPAPSAFAATLLTQAELRRRNIEFTAAYVSSHDSVYRAVASGLYAAGGGIRRTLESARPVIRSKLRILHITEGYTPHAIIVHPRVPTDVANAIQRALVTLHSSADGRSLLKRLSIEGFETAVSEDWNNVRQLGIEMPIGNR